MIPYFATFGILVFAAISTAGRQQKVTMLAILSVFLWWFMGSRYYVGCDFNAYLQRFGYFRSPGSLTALFERPEWGFEALVWLVKSLGLNFVWVNMFAAMAYTAGFFTLYRRHPEPLFLLATAFPVMMIQLGMSGTRQCIAVAILMFAYEKFRQESKIGTAIFILIAMQFHSSAIIFLPLALLAGKQVSIPRILGALAIIGPVAGLLLASRFEVYSDRYIEDRYGALESNGALIRYILIAIPAVLFLRFRKQLEIQFPRDFNLMKVISLATFAILPIALINTTILHRLIYYLMPVSIITFVSVGSFVFGRSGKALGRVLPIFMYSGYMVFWFSLSRHADICYTPYNSFSLV